MNLNLTISIIPFKKVLAKLDSIPIWQILAFVSFGVAYGATLFALKHDLILTYGDAESHINIAKRVVDSITPGMAQLGGIWLPLPHLLMLPFVKFDILWRTGLAGSIVSGSCFIIASIYVYKLTLLITGNKLASLVSYLIFILNPNILYLQSTPLTEIPLVTFIILSTYYFVDFLINESILSIVLSAFFGFCATLSRYDGWFVVLIEAVILFLKYVPFKSEREKLQGLFLLFATPAFLGIFLWFGWGALILSDPLYFTNSPYSAKFQQQNWLAKGQLPAYHDLWTSFLYYFVDSMSNAGIIVFGLAIVGLFWFLFNFKSRLRLLIFLLLSAPFLFNVLSLFLGQSVIFIPHLTPVGFEWRLFNARYGVTMVPAAAILVGFLFYKVKQAGKTLIIGLLVLQSVLYFVGYSDVIALADGVSGLSSAKRPDAEGWLSQNYNGGLVLIDDYSRATSIIRSGISMQNIIYIGNKPYWQDSMTEPEKYARWVIIQRDDALWKNIYEKPDIQGRLYKYFNKVYTSTDILIFRRIE